MAKSPSTPPPKPAQGNAKCVKGSQPSAVPGQANSPGRPKPESGKQF